MNQRWSFCAVLGLALILGGCVIGTPPPTGPEAEDEAYFQKTYGWLDHADPVQQAQDDARAGNYHFLMTCGYACSALGLGANKPMCFQGVRQERVGHATDVLRGEREFEYSDRTARFVRDYNQVMARLLVTAGKSACAPGEDWDGAFDDVQAQLKNGSVTDEYSFMPDAPRTVIVFPPRAGALNDAPQKICAILKAHGIAGAELKIKDWNNFKVRADGFRDYAQMSFACG